MQILVTYDVSTVSPAGRKRLRRTAKVCLDYGQRVQNSVFECQVNPAQFIELKAKLLKIIDREMDSIRFYNLGAEWNRRVEHYGINSAYNPNDPLVL